MVKGITSCCSNIIYKHVEVAKRHPWLTASFLLGISALVISYLRASSPIIDSTSSALVPQDYDWVKERASQEAGRIVELDKNTMIKTFNLIEVLLEYSKTCTKVPDNLQFFVVRQVTPFSTFCQSYLASNTDGNIFTYATWTPHKWKTLLESWGEFLYGPADLFTDCSEVIAKLVQTFKDKCK